MAQGHNNRTLATSLQTAWSTLSLWKVYAECQTGKQCSRSWGSGDATAPGSPGAVCRELTI